MSTGAVIALVILLLVWSAVSGRLERLDISGPILFLGAGMLLSNLSWADVEISVESHTVHGLAEITLALLLFADAARVDPHDLRHTPACPSACSPSGFH